MNFLRKKKVVINKTFQNVFSQVSSKLTCLILQVHLSNKILMCRICEKGYGTQRDLALHMKANHFPSEMPYVCQLCNFRSSMYSDVVDHFKKVGTFLHLFENFVVL